MNISEIQHKFFIILYNSIISKGYKRAAVGYGPYDSHRGGVLGNLGGNFGSRFGGRLGGWRNSGWNSFNGKFTLK